MSRTLASGVARRLETRAYLPPFCLASDAVTVMIGEDPYTLGLFDTAGTLLPTFHRLRPVPFDPEPFCLRSLAFRRKRKQVRRTTTDSDLSHTRKPSQFESLLRPLSRAKADTRLLLSFAL
jgi:hypothetical protein